jgi:hypothetical protein
MVMLFVWERGPARARERQAVPISELVFWALTQNRSGLG